jgi:DNA-binding transcriptional MerR regulator
MATSDRGGNAPSTPPPMLTVAAVARRLGVAPSTLRTWDRRYDLGPSAHTAGSHRRYSPDDLARLVVMRRLTLEGVPPADAARIALAPPPEGPDPGVGRPDDRYLVLGEVRHDRPRSEHRDSDDRRSGDPDADPEAVGAGDTHSADADDDTDDDADDARAVRAETDPRTDRDRPGSRGEGLRPIAIPAARRGHAIDLGGPLLGTDRARHAGLGAWSAHPDAGTRASSTLRSGGRAGGGRVVALPDGSPAARGLARAAMSLDSAEVHRLFGDAVRSYGVRESWETLAMPVLQSIGERWRVTGDGVDVEHAFSEAIMTVLHSVTARLRRPRNGRPIVLTCAEGDYHTLPLHALAAALCEEAVGVRVLGVGMPASALVAAVRRCGPAAVFLYARLAVGDVEVLDLIPRQRPAPRLVLGGPGWGDRELPPQARAVTTLGDAVDTLVESVGL